MCTKFKSLNAKLDKNAHVKHIFYYAMTTLFAKSDYANSTLMRFISVNYSK